ncbi:MAG: hypothetical protein N2Z76_02495 [Treponemataceae bacterium]|nr:hypothetical protein [Treponemataceae bacterium]
MYYRTIRSLENKQKIKPRIAFLSSVVMFGVASLFGGRPALLAQDFGFGLATTKEIAQSGSSPSQSADGTTTTLTMSGTATIQGTLFVGETGQLWDQNLGDMVFPKLTLQARGSKVETYVAFNLRPSYLEAAPSRILDEVWVRLFVGPLTLDGGLMKVTWGKADSQGPLDVINPIDYTDLTITESKERKIAQPLVRLAWNIGDFTKLEGIWSIGFQGNQYDLSGRWIPQEFSTILSLPVAGGSSQASDLLSTALAGDACLDHSQGGLRFTTTTGPVDWGLQYFYGYLPNPAAKITLAGTYPNLYPLLQSLVYNRYHQAGFDMASVVAGFNLRAEGAANITADTSGDDPAVYNPHLAFSLGFDRDVVAGINLNVQYNGTYRLMANKIGTNLFDIEKDTETFTSSLTTRISQSLFQDTVKWECTLLWEVQDGDYLIIPKISWAIGDGEIFAQGGIFGGDSAGLLGQYDKNDYIILGMKYTF